MGNVVIAAGCRTPIGTMGGQFRPITALDLSVPVMQALVERAGIDPACIADVREESAANEEIIRLAEDNTIGLVKALLEPLFEQQDKDYTLEVKSSPSQLAQ